MKKHTPSNKPVNRHSDIEPYLVDSTDHLRAQQHIKPLHLNVDQLLKKNVNVTEINLKSTTLELVEDEQQAYAARKQHLLNNERRRQPRSRSATRYQAKNTDALVSVKNMLGLRKKCHSQLTNCSVHGAALTSNRTYKVGAIIHLQIQFPSAEQAFDSTAKVIYHSPPMSKKPPANNTHTIGLKFIKISNEYKDFIIKEGLQHKLRRS